MKETHDWKQYWDSKSEKCASDYDYDHRPVDGASKADDVLEQELRRLSEEELVNFIDPQPGDVLLDAGCGTGGNMLLYHSKVKRLIGFDYTEGAVDRCRQRLIASKMENAEVFQGSVVEIKLPNSSVDRAVCLSVFQYLNDAEVHRSLGEFRRVLTANGTLVLHVKNLSSLYLSTLYVAKKLKKLLGKTPRQEYVRTFGWYVKALRQAGFEIVDYNSADVFMVEKMPKKLVLFFRRLELRNRGRGLFRWAFIRRRGYDLKIKARLQTKA